MKILVADDDPNILDPLTIMLSRAGYEVLAASNGRQAWDFFRSSQPDFAVLDVNMPDVDGMTLLRRIGEAGDPRIPVIMLTGRGQTNDKIMGLDLGADDYIVKPCTERELLARIRAVWRRTTAPTEVLSAGDLAINLATHDFTLKGRHVDVTSNEFVLLQSLIEHEGRVVRYKELMQRIWGANVSHDLLRVTVFRLRRKIEVDAKAPRYIVTVPSVGFLLHSTGMPVAAENPLSNGTA